MQSKTPQNESIIYEANCKSINNKTTKEEILNFIAKNIFPAIHNCIIKDDIKIFPTKSVATFELKNQSQIKSLNKIINTKVQPKLNGNIFILNCRNPKPTHITIESSVSRGSPSTTKQTWTPSSNAVEVITHLDLSRSHSVSRSPVQITPIYPSLSSSPYYGSNNHTFSTALAKHGLQINQTSSNSLVKTSPHIKGISKVNKPAIDRETEFKMIKPTIVYERKSKITSANVPQCSPNRKHNKNSAETNADNSTFPKNQRRSSTSSNSSDCSSISSNKSHRSQLKNKIKNYMNAKSPNSRKRGKHSTTKATHITSKYDQIRQHYVNHAETINEQKTQYVLDRNKAFEKWTKLWQSQNWNVTSPIEVQTLIDFARLSLGYYSDWLLMKKNNQWITYFAVMKDFNLFLFRDQYTPVTLNDVVNRDYLAISLAHFKNIKQSHHRDAFCIETLGSKTKLRFKCESIECCQKWVVEMNYQMLLVSDLCCNQSVTLECADSKASIWIPVAPLAFLNPYQQANVNTSEQQHDERMDDLHILSELEDIINEEMTNMLQICGQFDEFKKQLLSGKYSPTQCPGGADKNDGSCNYQKNDGNNSSSNNSHGNGKHNRNNKGRGDGNDRQNGWSRPNKYNKYAKTTSMRCTHLGECNDCMQAVKYWQNIVAEKNQHIECQTKTHLKFQELLNKAITNTSKKKRKKQKLKNQMHVRQNNKVNSDPISSLQNVNNKTYISNKILQNIKQNAIKVPQHVRHFMNASIELQKNMAMDDSKSDRKIMDFGFMDKNTNEHLYCLLQKKKHTDYNWKMNDKLLTNTELAKLSLQPTLALKFTEETYVNKIKAKMNGKVIQKMINKCKWNKLALYIRKNNEQRMTLAITPEQLSQHIKTQSSNNINLIPIIGYNNRIARVDFIWVIHIDRDIDIGLSLEYNKQKDILSINGIHIDKNYLLQQHYLVSPYHMNECNCLNEFTSIIHDIHVGNPDDLHNKAKDFKQRYEALKGFYNSFRNENESKESMQNNCAEIIMNMHDNGDLFKEVTTTPSVLSTASSASVCPSTVSSNNPSPPPIIINNGNKTIQTNKYMPSQPPQIPSNNGYNCISAVNNGVPATVLSVINNNFNVTTLPSPYINNGMQNMNYLLQSQMNMCNLSTNMQFANANNCNFNFQSK